MCGTKSCGCGGCGRCRDGSSDHEVAERHLARCGKLVEIAERLPPLELPADAPAELKTRLAQTEGDALWCTVAQVGHIEAAMPGYARAWRAKANEPELDGLMLEAADGLVSYLKTHRRLDRLGQHISPGRTYLEFLGDIDALILALDCFGLDTYALKARLQAEMTDAIGSSDISLV